MLIKIFLILTPKSMKIIIKCLRNFLVILTFLFWHFSVWFGSLETLHIWPLKWCLTISVDLFALSNWSSQEWSIIDCLICKRLKILSYADLTIFQLDLRETWNHRIASWQTLYSTACNGCLCGYGWWYLPLGHGHTG